MTSSFLCDNCGIKVTGPEGTECPGCGHIASENGPTASSRDNQSNETLGSKPGIGDFNKKNPLGFWGNQHLKDCEALFDKNKPYFDQPDIVDEVINRTKSKIQEAPDEESSFRLYAYMSEMYRMTQRYNDSYENGVNGVKSSETFFKNQSHNSILDSLLNLNKYHEFETWTELARKDKFPDVDYYRMRYLTKLEKFEEALVACESHFSSNRTFANSNRADILVKAKRFDEAEQIFRKLIANGPQNEFVSNWINSLAFSILMPQGRLVEAESVLITSLCTNDYREKINSYSNLGMVAFKFKEYDAAKRYARIAANHPDNAIASESRLTLCEIDYQRLEETTNAPKSDWLILYTQVKESLSRTDFDDAAKFLSLLIKSAQKSEQDQDLFQTIESESSRLTQTPQWQSNNKVRKEFESLRIDLLARKYLSEKKFLELDAILIPAIEILSDLNVEVLLEYLRTPFADINLRRAALKCTNLNFLATWSSFEEQKEIIYSLAKYQEEPILVALAENPYTPDTVCELIASKNDIDLDFALCERSNLSLRMAQLLGNSAFEAVRRLIASRVDLDDEMYRKLATDSASLVRDAVRENQSCSAEIRALAALGSL